MIYLVSIRIGQNETDRYVEAASEQEAIDKVRSSLDTFARRWANVFVG